MTRFPSLRRPVHHPARRFTAVLAALTTTATLGIAPSALADDAPAPFNGGESSASQPVTVRVPLVTVPNTFGQSGVVRIRVGRSAPMPVILDTGSTGLRLFPGALDRYRTGADVSQTRVSTPNVGGQLRGYLASAPITIGGVTTTRDIGFQVIKNSSPWVQQWLDKGVYGILGTGTRSAPLPNPLLALPGNAGQRWSIHFGGIPAKRTPGGGSLILGAEAPADAVANLTLPPQGPDGFGALLWNDHSANGCWTVAKRRTVCLPTWFDSVADRLTLSGPPFAGLPTDADGFVKSGIPIHLSAAGSAFNAWSVVTGTLPSFNLTTAKAKAPRVVNTGNRLYYDFTVTYDVVKGLISLSDPRN